MWWMSMRESDKQRRASCRKRPRMREAAICFALMRLPLVKTSAFPEAVLEQRQDHRAYPEIYQ